MDQWGIDCGEASPNHHSAPPAAKVPVVPQERLACWVLALLQDFLQVAAGDPNAWCPLSLNQRDRRRTWIEGTEATKLSCRLVERDDPPPLDKERRLHVAAAPDLVDAVDECSTAFGEMQADVVRLDEVARWREVVLTFPDRGRPARHSVGLDMRLLEAVERSIFVRSALRDHVLSRQNGFCILRA